MFRLRNFILLVALVIMAVVSINQSDAKPETSVGEFTAVSTINPLLCNLTPNDTPTPGCHASMLRDYLPAFDNTAVANAPCTDNLSNNTFPCHKVHLQSNLPMSDIGGGEGNDLWGWTDPQTDREYALMGRTNGTAFIDVTDPVAPLYLGNLPTHSVNSIWRDIKVYQNHAYIVADSANNHGMQIFDLTQLRTVTAPPVTFVETAHYDQFGSAHNIFINESSGFAYVVRVSSGSVNCNGGLHMINLQNPTAPQFAGCYDNGAYTHDTQCVLYSGPDLAYTGQEICISANESEINVVDVTNKSAPADLATATYPAAEYVHQGWLTDDQRYYLQNDELDESDTNQNARTYIWDVSDLDKPELVGTYTAVSPAIDHNLYIHNGLVYQSNYRSGLRILTLDQIANGTLTEVGYFDTFPALEFNEVRYNGAWSNYPFFESGNIIVSTIEHGLFVLKVDDAIHNNPINFNNYVYLPLVRK